LFRSKYTFAITAPQVYKTVADSIHGANSNLPWYRDNNYPFIACQIAEYGIAYCQYSYSLPRPITEFYHLLMMVNYPDFFAALGFTPMYDKQKSEFDATAIMAAIQRIIETWKDKYPHMEIKMQNLRFDKLVNFNFTFTNELEVLNMDQK
jgi:hypothetical protein